MRVLICGDRNWTDEGTILQKLLELYAIEEPVIIVGGARGADMIAEREAKDMGWKVEVYPAEWERYGRRAGPLRNQQMLDEGKPDLVMAFHDDLKQSKGTKDMVRRAKKAGVPFEVVKSEKEKKITLEDLIDG